MNLSRSQFIYKVKAYEMGTYVKIANTTMCISVDGKYSHVQADDLVNTIIHDYGGNSITDGSSQTVLGNMTGSYTYNRFRYTIKFVAKVTAVDPSEFFRYELKVGNTLNISDDGVYVNYVTIARLITDALIGADLPGLYLEISNIVVDIDAV